MDITKDFTILSDVNPWVDASWTKPTGSIDARITESRYVSTSSTNSVHLYIDQPTPVSDELTVSVVIGGFTGDPSGSRGCAIMDSNGDGYFILVRSTDLRVYRATESNTITQIGSTTTVDAADNDIWLLGYTVTGGSAGAIRVLQNGVSRFTATDSTHLGKSFRVGVLSRSGLGRIRSVTAYNIPDPQAVNSINSGNDIIEGQSAVPADLSGFTSRPTSITTNQTGITCSNIGGTTNAPTFDLSGWTEGQPYPVLPATVQFTFTYSTESAAGTETVTYDPAYTKVVFSSPIIDNSALPTYWIEQDGHTADGGAFYYDAYSDLVVSTDGDFTVTDSGQFTAWFRPASGATSGNMYEYIFTVVDGSIVSAESGLTSRGLTNTGLVNHGLVSRGL